MLNINEHDIIDNSHFHDELQNNLAIEVIENMVHENNISVTRNYNDISEEAVDVVHAEVTDLTDRSREHRSKLVNEIKMDSMRI